MTAGRWWMQPGTQDTRKMIDASRLRQELVIAGG